jgi:tetratricopeptide (TPR) repeat protein
MATAGQGADIYPDAGQLWEQAAKAASKNADWAGAVQFADRAADHHLERGQARAAARAQAIAGEALQLWGHHSEARDRLTAAVQVLRPAPDSDTVRALSRLADLETFAGSPEQADQLTTEALVLGQDLSIGLDLLGDLLLSRGICLSVAKRQAEAVAYLRESARIATQASDNFQLGRVLLNLGAVLSTPGPVRDRAASLEAARSSQGHLRRAGARDYLAYAVANVVTHLIDDGDWDGAEEELKRAMDSDGLADIEVIASKHAYLAALRGDAATAETTLAVLTDTRASESPQEQAALRELEAFTAAARHQPETTLRHARAALGHMADAGQIEAWSWSLAVRTAHDLDDLETVRALLTLLDSAPPGQLTPMLRTERDLARARLAVRGGDQAAAAALTAAVASLREHSTPYHLAQGLLDHAAYLIHLGDTEAAETSITEARTIASRLRCQPLLDRAAERTGARPPVQA